MPCSDFCIYLFFPIGIILGEKVGTRNACLVALTLHYISYLLLLLIPNYYIVLFSFCIFGAGGGLTVITYQKNCWKYFPNSQGLVNGIIMTGGGLSSSILTPIADYWIINPDRKEPNKETGFYPDDIGNNLVKYLKILFGIFIFLGILAILFTINYEDNERESNDETAEIEKKENINNSPLKEAFFSIKNLKMIFFCFCGLCKILYNNFLFFFIVFDLLIANCNRDFGNRKISSQDAIFILGICFGLVNGSARFIWGLLMDKFGFKPLMITITLIEVIISASLYYLTFSPVIYIIGVLLIASCIGGNFTIIPPCYNKIFSIELGPKVYGISGNFIGVTSVCGPLMTKFLIKKTSDYLIVFLISCFIASIKLVVLFFFNENDKFQIITEENIENNLDNKSNENGLTDETK